MERIRYSEFCSLSFSSIQFKVFCTVYSSLESIFFAINLFVILDDSNESIPSENSNYLAERLDIYKLTLLGE